MIEHRPALPAAAVALTLTLALASCGDRQGVTVEASALGIASSPTSQALASTTVTTSPDGGIYKDPNTLRVLLVAHLDPAPLTQRLGSAASSWGALAKLGRLTAVGFELDDAGKAFSDPQLTDLQIASDLAPDGTDGGELRHFYHPTFPLAVLTDGPVSGECGIHLDPGQHRFVLLVYPPSRPGETIVWGRYQEFALRVPFGGAAPASAATLHAVTCAAPTQPPP